MISIYHGQACWWMLKHNTNEIEVTLFGDEEKEYATHK
jgi:hypothetical protein